MCSLRVTGYTPDGRRIVADDGPSRARVAHDLRGDWDVTEGEARRRNGVGTIPPATGYGGSVLGQVLTGVLTAAQRKADWQRRDRAKRKETP